MPHNQKHAIDQIDRLLIATLNEDARISMKDLAQKVSMSAPSVTERVRRLSDTGVIAAFTIELNAKALGYDIEAIVRAKPLQGQLHLVERIFQDMPECTQCYKVTGEDCFVAHICLPSIEKLDSVMQPLKDRAETNTSIIHATPVRRRLPLVTTTTRAAYHS